MQHPPSSTLHTTCCLTTPAASQQQVLRFYGYFKESIAESRQENHRIRKVILYYYLEDNSMHVAEPRQDNSGIPQVGDTGTQQTVCMRPSASEWISVWTPYPAWTPYYHLSRLPNQTKKTEPQAQATQLTAAV